MQASDTSEIKEVKAELYLNDSVTPVETINASRVSQDSDIYNVVIPCNESSYNGTLKLRLIAVDNANREQKINNDFTIDNADPVITISLPAEDSEQSGVIKEAGAINENVQLWYSVSPFATSPDNITETTEWKYTYDSPDDNTVVGQQKAPKNKKSIKSICAYKPVGADENEKFMSFQILFDGDIENATGVHSETINDWLISMGITEQDDITNMTFDDIVYIWLHTKAKDAAGNITEVHRKIYWDPLGNRPKLTMSYPEKEGDTIGGTVTLMGTAMGTETISSVTVTIDNTSYNNVRLQGAGWSCSVDTTQLNNTTTPKEVTIKVLATDDKGNTSRVLERKVMVDTDTPIINQNLRLVQWKQNVTSATGISGIENDGTISFAANSFEKNIPYSEGTNVSGEWYLVGYATDNNKVNSISYDNGVTEVSLEGKAAGTVVLNANGRYIKKISDSKVLFSFRVGSTDTNTVGSSLINLIVKDNTTPVARRTEREFEVSYDNKKPDLIKQADNDSRYKIDSSVYNSNGVYTLGSVATEAAVNGVNQTGVKRIAFYFTKALTSDDTTTYSIFDTAITRSDTANANTTSGNEINSTTAPGATTGYGSLKFEEKLWWKEKTGVTIEDAVVKLTAKDNNIHKGTLVKVNGAIYSVISVSQDGKSITLDDIPGSASTVKIAIASVVDGNANNETIKKQTLNPQGNTYTWSASIDSRNLPDGSAVLHYVVFDGAGNYDFEDVACTVQNKAPRIVGMKLGTDDNGNGEVDTDEYNNTQYTGAFANGYITNNDNTKTRAVNVTFPVDSTNEQPKSALRLKGKTIIKPEIVGGTGSISYTYKVAKRSGNGWEANPYYSYTTSKTLGAATGEDTAVEISNDIVLNVTDMVGNTTPIQGGKNQKFIFEIADSTPGTPLVARMNVIMDVDFMDETPATSRILPFYWNSLKDNSLYDSTAAESWMDLKGHIELSKDLNAIGSASVTPKVSGKIKIEGIARDEVLLKDLSVKIGFSNNTFTLASFDTSATTTGFLKPATQTMAANGWSVEIKQATYGEYMDAGYITELPAGKTRNNPVPYFSQDYGHVVHWVLNLDTEQLNNTTKAKEGVVISAIAQDRGKPNASGVYTTTGDVNNGNVTSITQTGGNLGSSTGVDNTGKSYYTCKYTVDVVPYIMGIKTKLSTKLSGTGDSSEYDRTANGHYPLASTETAYFYGFNLKQAATVTDSEGHKRYLGQADSSTYPGFTVYPTTSSTTGAITGQGVVTNISNFVSGQVTITVDNVESWNNKNNNDGKGSYIAGAGEEASTTCKNSYNRKPNTVNNYILTDDVIMDVWEFNSKAAKTYVKGVASDPVMKINPANGIIGFAYQSGTRRFNMGYGKTSSYQGWQRDFDNLSATGFAYDSAGNSYGCAQGGDINSSYSVSTFCFFTSSWGVSGIDTDYGALNGPHAMRVEQIGQIGKKGEQNSITTYGNETNSKKYIDKTRVLSPAITVSGSDANAKVYMAYYDHLNREIRFRWAANPKTGGNTKGWDGTSYIPDNYTGGAYNNLTGAEDKYVVNNFQIIAEYATESGSTTDSTTLGKPGAYVDIAVLPNAGGTGDAKYDVVVMVWYDSEHDNLMYTYNKIALDSTKNAQNQNISFVGSANTQDFWQEAQTIFEGAGQYCKIAVDADNGIHIAAYDSVVGDVRYAYLQSFGADNYDEATDSCLVDSSGIIGSNITLDVAKNEDGVAIPFIGYYGESGPKMARLNPKAIPASVTTTAGKTSTIEDMFTGYWEVTEVPTPSNAPKDRINVGVWKDADGVLTESVFDNTPAAKTPAGTSTEATDAITRGNGTKNAVVAYQIRPSSSEGYIETAQMK
jgi:hypothetical protein